MTPPDVLVVGAGIVGAAIAHELRQRGITVSLLDARCPAATDAGMGHLVTMEDDAAEFALARASMTVWREWQPRLPSACAFAEIGTLWLAADEAEVHEAQRKQQRLAAGGVASEWLDAAQLKQAEPHLAADLAGGLRVPGDAIVYAPAVARWLLRQAPSDGADVRRHEPELEPAEVVAIEADGSTLRLADGTTRSAGCIVLATGADARALCPELPVVPKKGHLIITDRYPGTVRHQLVELGYAASTQATSGINVAFNLQPRPTGQLLIGSSRQFDSADASVDADVIARMLKRALRYMPALARMNAIRSWTGLRPATPDGLPIIGPHPSRPRLWLAVGHEGLGVTTAPGTALLIAAGITGAAPPLDAAPYRAARFELKAAA